MSIPASLGLIIGSEEIVNALFGYGSFTIKDVNMTAKALEFFGYGIPAFALIKILSNFFFARNNTKTPFYISLLIVVLNISISLIFFKKNWIHNYSNRYFIINMGWSIFICNFAY